MRRRLTAAAVLLAALVLAACSPISSGTITSKDHKEGYYYTTYVQQCSSYDPKSGACRTYIQIPQQQYSPPNWKFSIRDGDDQGWVYVNEDTYGRYEVGDYYNGGD